VEVHVFHPEEAQREMLALRAADVHLQSVVLAACNWLWGM
jgi:hypothetical protein